jgi:hypothetical protein
MFALCTRTTVQDQKKKEIPTMTSSSLERLYTTCMALNNRGISLLTRGHTEDAIIAFGDAITLMRQVSLPFERRTRTNSASVEAKLERAARTLARSALDVSTTATKNNNKGCNTTKYCVISQDDCAATIRSFLQTNKEDTETVFLIRLELSATSSIPADTTNEKYLAAFESSILLYNCANAHLSCSSSWAGTRIPSEETLIVVDSCISILHHAFTILEHIMLDDDEHLPLAILVLRMLVLVPWMIGVVVPAACNGSGTLLDRLVHLQEKFYRLDSPTWWQHIAAGAA